MNLEVRKSLFKEVSQARSERVTHDKSDEVLCAFICKTKQDEFAWSIQNGFSVDFNVFEQRFCV